jgi:hypothetical protein
MRLAKRPSTPCRFGQRGVALPAAVVALMLLTTLLISFAVLSKSEPTIAANHALTAQARALAEGGVERAVWALTSATAAGGIPDPLAGTIATPPYDGSTFVALGSAGGFFLTVTSGTVSNERVVNTVGWAPTNAATDPRPKSHRRIHLVLTKAKWLDPPGALSVRGEAKIAGSVLIDSRLDGSCGPKAGVFTTDDTSRSGSADVYGYGNSTPNETTGSPADIMANQPTSVFDQHIFTDADLDMLRGLAKCCGTYIGPGSPSSWSSNASITFNTGNKLPRDGLIFIDTRTGTNPTSSTPDADMADVRVTGNAEPAGQTEWHGWLIVNGGLDWQGTTRARGLLYAQNDISWSGRETLWGAVVSRNIKDTSATNIDSTFNRNGAIIYDCAAARSGVGTIPQGWVLKTGTYRELSD